MDVDAFCLDDSGYFDHDFNLLFKPSNSTGFDVLTLYSLARMAVVVFTDIWLMEIWAAGVAARIFLPMRVAVSSSPAWCVICLGFSQLLSGEQDILK